MYPVAVFEPPEAIPEALSFFAPFFIPKILQDEYRLKEYILRGGVRCEFRRVYGDRQAVDAIFNRALQLCWNNTGEALIICLLSTMDHRTFGVDLPLIGDLIWVPLTSEFPDEFQSARSVRFRRSCMPTRRPERRATETSCSISSAPLPHAPDGVPGVPLTGPAQFVEWGEEQFIVGGVNDERDLRADRQGQQFGLGTDVGHPGPAPFRLPRLA